MTLTKFNGVLLRSSTNIILVMNQKTAVLIGKIEILLKNQVCRNVINNICWWRLV